MFLIKSSKVIINFSKQFYSEESLYETKKEYDTICNSTIIAYKGYFKVELMPASREFDLRKLALEFSNYALSVQK